MVIRKMLMDNTEISDKALTELGSEDFGIGHMTHKVPPPIYQVDLFGPASQANAVPGKDYGLPIYLEKVHQQVDLLGPANYE